MHMQQAQAWRLTIRRFVPIFSLLALVVFAISAAQRYSWAFDFVWRPFAAVFIAALVLNLATLAVMLSRSSVRKGAFHYFVGMLCASSVFLLLTVLVTLGRTPEAAAFWQGLLPVGWLPIPALVLMFVLAYTEDRDVPESLAAWIGPLIPLPLFLYAAGMTDLIEHHVPYDSTLLPWGWQNSPGDLSPIPFAWAFLLSVTGLIILVSFYRRQHGRARKQARIFVVAIAQMLVLATSLDLVGYSIIPNGFPGASFVYYPILDALIAYGLLRYGIFQISPAALSDTVLENLAEAVIGLDTEWRVEFANGATEKLTSVNREQITGMPLSGLVGDKLAHELKSKPPRRGNQLNFESEIVTSHRTTPVMAILSPIYDAEGRLAGYVLILQNVSALKRKTEELAREKESVEHRIVERTRELRDERARLNAAIESLSLGFALVGVDGEIVVQNKSLRHLFRHRGQYDNITEIAKVFEAVNLVEQCAAAMMAKSGVDLKEVNANSGIFHVLLSPVVSGSGDEQRAIGTAMLIEDITEAKALERSKDEFFSIASHELRTPLTTIRGNAKMMIDLGATSLKDEEIRGMVEDIYDSSKRLTSLVNDFLDVSRIEQGQAHLELEQFPLSDVIIGAVNDATHAASIQNIYLRADGAQLGKLPNVYADKHRTRQIIDNLIGNAVKFTAAGGVTIAAEVDGSHVKVSVQDTGRGIGAKTRGLLFRKFQQATESLLTRETFRGTGLGLYVCRLLLQMMDGDVWLQDSTEGKGSTFCFTLPIATPGYVLEHANTQAHQAIDVRTGLTVAATSGQA